MVVVGNYINKYLIWMEHIVNLGIDNHGCWSTSLSVKYVPHFLLNTLCCKSLIIWFVNMAGHTI